MTSGLFRSDRVCTKCDTAYSSKLSLEKCPNCLSTSWSRIPDAPIPGAPYRPSQAVPFNMVQITGIDLSWGDVFTIAFKFMVVFTVFQSVFVAIAIAIWR
jgi:hypothetical protein